MTNYSFKKVKNTLIKYLLSLGSHHVEFVHFGLQRFVLDAQILLRARITNLRQVLLHLPGREEQLLLSALNSRVLEQH